MQKVIVTVKHDIGRSNISVWADSLEGAIEQVMKVEGCPRSAIIRARVPSPTIYEVKRNTQETAPYFFSRKTLSFFKQRMSDFSVTRIDESSFLISAPSFGGNKTKRIYNAFAGTLEQV